MAVFVIGFARLWWTSRHVKKHTLLDEEKALKIQELRRKGHTIKSEREDDPPFGVRAIESGIEIDGIWVSRSNTPISGSLRTFRSSDRSSFSSVRSTESTRTISPEERLPRIHPNTEGPLHAIAPGMLALGRVLPGDSVLSSPHGPLSRPGMSTYKPRRSSQLRFSSYADMQLDKETLSKLEGVARPNSLQLLSSNRSSYQAANQVDPSSESVPDIEHSSGTYSDGGLSPRPEVVKQAEPSLLEATRHTLQKGKGRVIHKPSNSTGSIVASCAGDYFSLPHHSPPQPKSSPLITPELSPTITPSIPLRDITRAQTDETEASAESQLPLLSDPFPDVPQHVAFMPGVPGTIHINKTYRRVNSSFEVFPAGSFDKPDVYTPTNAEVANTRPAKSAESKTSPRRLQKKQRTIFSRRGSRVSGGRP